MKVTFKQTIASRTRFIIKDDGKLYELYRCYDGIYLHVVRRGSPETRGTMTAHDVMLEICAASYLAADASQDPYSVGNTLNDLTPTYKPKNATEARKLDALRTVHNAIPKTEKGRVIWDRALTAAAIGTLRDKIRSAKWDAAVTAWVELIEDRDNDVTWAYYQGSVWFGYATLA